MLVPSEEEFLRLAGDHNLIPVYREVVADLETPISAFCKLAAKAPCYLLESAEGPERVGRYSFLGFDPLWTAVAREGVTTVSGRLRGRFQGNPLHALRALLSGYRVAALPGLPRFFGGAVGFFAAIQLQQGANPHRLGVQVVGPRRQYGIQVAQSPVGLLQAQERFVVPALVGFPMNFVIILAVVLFAGRFGIHALAVGAAFAAVALAGFIVVRRRFKPDRS